MSLTLGTRKRLKVAGTLSDAHPTFVSLVGHGANQTPFHVIKHDDMKIEKTSKGFALGAGIEIAKIEFLATKFSDEAAVNTYLNALGFTDYTVEKGEGDVAFVVKGMAETSFESTPEAIPFAEDGSVIYAGKVLPDVQKGLEKKDDKPAVTDAKWLTAKGESVVAKFDWYLTYESNGKTVKDVVADAMQDGVPIGFDEASRAFKQAMSNCIKTGDVAALPALATEFGAFLQSLASFTATNFTAKAEDVKALMDAFLAPSSEAKKSDEPPTPPAPVAPPTPDAPPVDAMAQVLTRLSAMETSITEQKEAAVKSAETITSLEKQLKEAATALEVTKKTANDAAVQLAQVTRLRMTRGSDDPAPAPPKAPAGPREMTRAEKNAAGQR